RGKVEDNHPHAGLAEASGRMDHEGALAHLAAGQHVAKLAAQQAFVEIAVRLALDVRGGVLAERAARDVEAGRVGSHIRYSGHGLAKNLTLWRGACARSIIDSRC